MSEEEKMTDLEIRREVEKLLREDKRINAVKFYKKQTGADMMAAMEYINKLNVTVERTPADRWRGCAMSILLIIVFIFIVILLNYI